MTNLEDALGEIDVLAAAEPADAAPMKSALDDKINERFAGAVVRKDLVKAVRGNAVVPSYVLEYLLGQYAASDDEATIQAGIDSVRQILATHYVNRNEHMLVKSEIRRKGRHRVIDKVTVTLNEKNDVHEAEFENLQVKGVIIDDITVKRNPKLLVGGVWCICDIEYFHSDDQRVVPWILGSLKPIQVAGVDIDHYYEAREAFTTEEWIDLLMQSIGLNPEQFNERGKLIALTRLIPFVERNYNVVELGPKGTGKSHTFSEFSPNGILLSGGEVTVAKLFVNNASGRIGLVGYWDCVAFDEFAANRRTDQNLVNVMKNYLANWRVVLAWHQHLRSRCFDGVHREHDAHRAVHAQEQRPVRRIARRLPRSGLARSHPPLHSRLGGRADPLGDVLQWLRVRRRLPR